MNTVCNAEISGNWHQRNSVGIPQEDWLARSLNVSNIEDKLVGRLNKENEAIDFLSSNKYSVLDVWSEDLRSDLLTTRLAEFFYMEDCFQSATVTRRNTLKTLSSSDYIKRVVTEKISRLSIMDETRLS